MTENEAIERLKCMRLFMQMNDKTSESKFLEEDYIANKLAIKALEEIQQYQAIGTVEECREARERQTEKKPLSRTRCKDGNHPLSQDIGRCPSCNSIVAEDMIWCDDCGQKLDWNDTP